VTDLVRVGAVTALEREVPADRNPVNVYLGRLRTPRARAVQLGALEACAGVLLGQAAVRGVAMAFPWWELRHPHTAKLRADLLERYAPATVRRLLSAVRGVLEECWTLGLMAHDDYARAARLKPIRGERLPRGRALSAGELRALFEACAPAGVAGARDAALVAILYGAGLRRAEAVALDLEDFDPATGALHVRHGKGDKARQVYATNGGRRAVLAWLEHRGPDPGALLLAVGKGGRIVPRRLTAHATLKALARLARRAGVARFSPHDLRRSYVSDLLDAGADVATVAKLAGHAQLETTRVYDRRPEEAKRKAAELLHVPYVPTGA